MAAILLSQFVLSLLTLFAARKRRMSGWATALLLTSLLLGMPLLGFMLVAMMPKRRPGEQQEQRSRKQAEAGKAKGQQQRTNGRGRSVKERTRERRSAEERPVRKLLQAVRQRVAGLFSRETPQQRDDRLQAQISELGDRIEQGKAAVSQLKEKDALYRSQPDMLRMLLNEMRLTRAERSLARDMVRLDDLKARRDAVGGIGSGPDVRVHSVPDMTEARVDHMDVKDDMGEGRLFALGHGSMGEDEFRDLLARNRIDLVVDVRSLPVSRHSPHFNGGDADAESGLVSPLERSLEAAGVSYQWLGQHFGSHHYREDNERKHVYLMWHQDGSVAGKALFGNDDECNDYCVSSNALRDEDECICTYRKATESEVREILESADVTAEMKREIADSTGDYLTYDELRGRYDFQLNLANLRDCVAEGNRVLLLGRAADPLESHCFSLLGRELAHPSDPLTEPMDICHLTRGGRSYSQSELEERMLSVQHLGSGPDDLDRAYRDSCSAIIGAKVFDREMENGQRQSSVRLA
jgi:hypothetical protein